MNKWKKEEPTNTNERKERKTERIPLFEYVKLPLGKTFLSAHDIVKASIMKQTILFYTECP